ncbi:MAG TPA: Nramp family divalent metal transporter [Terriglobia bacterium]|jgi:manganese transport protein|nr:Nramp family divalent metal transporter [Terriglobia bacterium]
MDNIHPDLNNNAPAIPSLPEAYRSVGVPAKASFWKKLFAFSGPGFLVAVGYMDPGNWATDIAAGSRFAYELIFILFLSNLMAILLQTLSARLGIATQRDLAQACHDYYSRRTSFILWVLCEIAIAACDMAEVIGSAIALNLLFHIPLIWGVCLTAFDVLAILYLQHKGFRYLEVIVVVLIGTIAACYLVEMFIVKPEFAGILRGFIPTGELFTNREMLYIAIGILGATVMPHNLYLHSSLVQTRAIERTPEGLRTAMRFNFIDSVLALNFAFFINAAILIMAAATFYRHGLNQIAEIQDAYHTLAPLLGVPAASLLFALALLCSGQNSTLTGTLAGQIVMEGFLNFRIAPWLRRLITRLIAIIPTIIVVALAGASGTARLLILSQVILSLQLSFAVFPLVQFTSDRRKMGEFANPRWLKVISWTVGIIIAGLNAYLLVLTAKSWLT